RATTTLDLSRRHACHTSRRDPRCVRGGRAPSPYAARRTLVAGVTPLQCDLEAGTGTGDKRTSPSREHHTGVHTLAGARDPLLFEPKAEPLEFSPHDMRGEPLVLLAIRPFIELAGYVRHGDDVPIVLFQPF